MRQFKAQPSVAVPSPWCTVFMFTFAYIMDRSTMVCYTTLSLALQYSLCLEAQRYDAVVDVVHSSEVLKYTSQQVYSTYTLHAGASH
jgi:hypothetical protein